MITGMKYRELLKYDFGPEVDRLNITSRYWFTQDGTRPHRTADVFTCLETVGQNQNQAAKNQKIDFFSFQIKLIPHYSKLIVDLSMHNVFVLYLN